MNNIFVSTACLKGDKSYDRVLNEFLNNKIKNIELTGVHPFVEENVLEEIIKSFTNKGARFTFHNYFPPPKNPIVLNYLTQNPDLKMKCQDIIRNAINLAKKTGVKTYAFHPGYYREAEMNRKGYFDFFGNDRLNFDYGLDIFKKDFVNFYKTLKIGDKHDDVFIGFENLFPNPDGTNDSFMCTYEEISKVFDHAKKENIKLKLLIDLGHLAISANFLKFDRMEFLDNILNNYGDNIFEVHISENDCISDLHNRININSWQLEALKLFKKLKNYNEIIFTYESRGMTISEIKDDLKLINKTLNYA
jgi:sugar phosphate isomerase/epimerase